MSPSGNTRPRDHDASPGPTVSSAVSPSLFGEKSKEDALTAPEGAGGFKLLLLDERCDSSVDIRECVHLLGLEAVASPLARRVVSVLVPAPLVATLPDARGLACMKTEQGLQIFMSGARVVGSIGPTGSFPLGLEEKRDEVANLVYSSLMGKKIERPLLSPGNTGSGLAKDLGVLVLAFPHFKPTVTS